MSTYRSEVNRQDSSTTIYKIGFGTPAQNDEIVLDAAKILAGLSDEGQLGGGAAFLNGPASLPVACVLAHKLSHLHDALYVFDPKLQGYICSISHSPSHAVGDLVFLAK